MRDIARARPRVLVVQPGARHRYAIPRILDKAGQLSALITDSHATSIAGRMASILNRMLRSPRLDRLGRRKVEGIDLSRVHSEDVWILYESIFRQIQPASRERARQYRDKFDLLLKRSRGLGDANMVYSFGVSGLDFLEFSRSKGLKIVLDAFISPLATQQVDDEQRRLSLARLPSDSINELLARYRRAYALADCILCPSEWVRSGVLEVFPEAEQKLAICPYGSSLGSGGAERKPTSGRLFWAGHDWLRKGLHHLAAIGDRLRSDGFDHEIRAAGAISGNVMEMPQFKNVNFLGQLDSAQMREEFSRADFFVFPTLTEGMAGVVIEALFNGCPVITTRAAGIDGIVHGNNGFVVDPLDYTGSATLIKKYCIDRFALRQMESRSRQLAEAYSEQAWSRRLVPLIEDVLHGSFHPSYT